MVKNKWSCNQFVKYDTPKNPGIRMRNLRLEDMGAVIFGCTHHTIAECHSKQRFGLPAAHYSYVKHIKQGLPLFLFNYSDRTLHGIYEAASDGQFCPESNAWTEGGKGKTLFPAQVAMRIRMRCQPLTENEFRAAIQANYQSTPGQKPHYFRFELDRAQTSALMAMFKPASYRDNFQIPPVAPRPTEAWLPVPASIAENEGNSEPRPEMGVMSYANVINKKYAKSYADMVNKDKSVAVKCYGNVEEYGSSSKQSSALSDDLDRDETSPEGEDFAPSHAEAWVPMLASIAENGGHWEPRPEMGVKSYADAINKKYVKSYADMVNKDKSLVVRCDGNVAAVVKTSNHVKSYADAVNKNNYAGVGCDGNVEYGSSSKKMSAGFNDFDCEETSPDEQDFAPSDIGDQSVAVSQLTVEGEVMHTCSPGVMQDVVGEAPEELPNLPEHVDAAKESELEQLSGGHSNLPETLEYCWKRSELSEHEQPSWRHSNLPVQAVDSKPSTEAELMQAVKELSLRIENMEKDQVSSDQEIKHLQDFRNELQQRIGQLNHILKKLTLEIDPSIWLDDSLSQLVEDCLGSDDVVYLIGGSNGFSTLSSLDSFSPSFDILTPLKPMSVAKSYTSAVALDGKIFVMGGLASDSWSSGVDCYDRRCDDWISCPALSCPKGCLGSVSLNGKIYAFGGGYGTERFCDVETFDPRHGRWIQNQPMLEKRFSLAGAELNGVIYAVGGFDGEKYLSSAECLDPREPQWRKLPTMRSARGSHTLSVYKEKLYSIGGFHSETMVSPVEIYEPRMPSWVAAEPMKFLRGFHAAAVLNGSIYVFGGVADTANNMLDVVECYREGHGWVKTGLRSVGRRSYFSAVAL